MSLRLGRLVYVARVVDVYAILERLAVALSGRLLVVHLLQETKDLFRSISFLFGVILVYCLSLICPHFCGMSHL